MESSKKELSEIELIDQIIYRLKNLKASIIKKNRLSEKAYKTNPHNSTYKQIEKTTNNLTWQCMEVEKQRLGIARLFEKSSLDVETGPTEFKPTGWHNYKV